jgi:asparagine synthase (glutamine-hydrolysing)
VPNPVPELEDLLACARLVTFARQLRTWALQRREPWVHLFWETVTGFLPKLDLGSSRKFAELAWMDYRFLDRNRHILPRRPARVKLLGPLPSLQSNLQKLDDLLRQLASRDSPPVPLLETRYPYLDRDFLEFMFRVPRNQLVRPGQRRSLMRRAMAGITPDEILQRKRKAFVARRTAIQVRECCADLLTENRRLASGDWQIINTDKFLQAVKRAGYAKDSPVVSLLRTLQLEIWLRGFAGSSPMILV